MVIGSFYRFFPFITLNISCHSLWLAELPFPFLSIQLRNQLTTWWEFLCMLFATFLLLLVIFYLISVFNLYHFDYYMSVCSSLGLSWDFLYFLDFVDCSFSHVREVFNYYLFKYFLGFFLSFFSRILIMQVLVCLMLSQRYLRFSSLFFILYSIFCSAAMISTILFCKSSICFSASVFLLLMVTSVLFGRRQWHPTPVLLPGKSHGWRSLVGCSPWGH